MRKVILLLLLLSTTIFSEDSKKKADVKSIDKERKETLLYGIDQEVKELIDTLKKDKIGGFDKEIITLLESSYDDTVKTIIFEYLTVMEISHGENEALKIFEAIEYEDEYSNNYAGAAISYLSRIKSQKAIDKIPDVINSENKVVVRALLKLIGENRVTAQEDLLLEMLDDDDTDDQIYLEVIKTLGKIKSQKALDILIPIADDKDEETTVRNAACFSLGEIGDDKAIDVLKRCLGDRSNYLLRKSALEALGKFETEEMNSILIDALRDPHWQIRYSACRSLGERKAKEAFPILKYKALKDPETKIKKEAFKAIGEINTQESRAFLKEVFISDSYKDSSRMTAIEKLIEHNLNWIISDLEKYYKENHMKKVKPILDYSMKLLSKADSNKLSGLYSLMLENENYMYRIHAIQGIRFNKMTSFKDRLKELSENDKSSSVKKYALAALEDL